MSQADLAIQASQARVYNFSAGPAVLPAEVLQQAADEMLSWQGRGIDRKSVV